MPVSSGQADARVVQALLADEVITERARMRKSGIPARTFERTTRRAYAEGWLFDRYVPSPAAFGLSSAKFVLVRLEREAAAKLEDQWTHDSRCVLLWKWPDAFFGVFFSRERPSGDVASWIPTGSGGGSIELTVDLGEPEVPIYFDFEGVWVAVNRIQGLLSYPQGLRCSPSAKSTATPATRASENSNKLVRRPFHRDADGVALRRSPFFLSRGERKSLRWGEVRRRVFLDLLSVPFAADRSPSGVAFIRGSLIPGSEPADLFRRLMRVGVRPFLFAVHSNVVFLATLTSKLHSPALSGSRPAILANIARFLQPIELLREPLAELMIPVNHRYDRLLER
jgi:hypothetical protein